MLRASYITWLRSSTDCPEILKAAARACRHQLETQGSDKYDKGERGDHRNPTALVSLFAPCRAAASNDRLIASAVAFTEAHAKKFAPSGSGVAPPSSDSWELVPGQLPQYTFAPAGEPEGGTAPFACQLPWLDAMRPAMELRFPCVVGMPDGLAFKLPGDEAVVGRTLSVTARIDASVKRAFHTTNLMMKAAEASAEAPAPSPQDVAPTAPPQAAAPPPLAPARVEAPPPPPRPASRHLPPRLMREVDAALAAMGYARAPAEARGDCAPLSFLAAAGRVTAEEAAAPTEATRGVVRAARGASVDLLVGTHAVGGVPTATLRREEGLRVTPAAAERQMAEWRRDLHWHSANAHCSAMFLFGLGVHLEQQVAVLEVAHEGFYADPARVYAARDASGLRRTPASVGRAETCPPYFTMPIAELLETLRAGGALVRFDGEAHFEPFVRAELAPTEPMEPEEAMAALDDLDVPEAELPYAAANLDVPPGGESAVADLDQQLQVAEQLREPGAQRALEEAVDDVEVAAIDEAARLAALGLRWEDDKREVLLGTAATSVDAVEALLEELRLDAVQVRLPDRHYHFERSPYGQRRLHCRSELPEALQADGDEDMPAPAPPSPVAAPPALAAPVAVVGTTVPAAAAPVAVAAAPVALAAAPVAIVAAPIAAAPAAPKRKQRAAAVRANAAFAPEETPDESPPPKAVKLAAAVAPDVREATLQAALSGSFRRFEVVRAPPEWLGDALQANSPTAARLHGALIVFRWEQFGWAPARLGPTADATSNYGALYADEWRQDHTLELETYGGAGYGAWWLLRATRAASRRSTATTAGGTRSTLAARRCGCAARPCSTTRPTSCALRATRPQSAPQSRRTRRRRTSSTRPASISATS